jgi:hypothetical protein
MENVVVPSLRRNRITQSNLAPMTLPASQSFSQTEWKRKQSEWPFNSTAQSKLLLCRFSIPMGSRSEFGFDAYRAMPNGNTAMVIRNSPATVDSNRLAEAGKRDFHKRLADIGRDIKFANARGALVL